ncbi:DNA polymerase III subunit epsilon [Vibrio navarrensis]|uniref:3'-5' exonuclease n=1 Tax=Vibrio navarrensis TaxID=29495 RepID=UPI0018670527|nr:3'-5' exonuclease [Vibrio navarrensis]MBE3655853.1 DNA polymerase III subunit epsilon [Vibrio navarrensis]
MSLFKPAPLEWQQKFAQKCQRVQDARLQRFYAQPLPLACTPINELEMVALDFETTGLDARSDDILSIGLVPFDLQRIYLNQAHHWTVRPRQNLSEESIVIHRITHSDIEHAPDLETILDEVLQQLAGKVVVVHYRHIERDFFDAALRQRIAEGIEFPLLDTLQLESDYLSQTKGGWWRRLKGVKLPSLRLAQTRRRYGLPDYSAHHALTDAIATAELLQAQFAHHYDAQSAVSEFWL